MNRPQKKGFTLVEMIVSAGLFIAVMFVATGSLLMVVNSDRKSRAIRIAADNLNIALEDMSRRIKTGTSYYCGTGGEALLITQDCISGGVGTFFFTDQNGLRNKYILDGTTNAIWRSVGLEPMIRTTSPEIKVTSLRFLVSGSTAGSPNNKQPIVVISIGGSLGAGAASSTFNIQTTVTQRAYDN